MLLLSSEKVNGRKTLKIRGRNGYVNCTEGSDRSLELMGQWKNMTMLGESNRRAYKVKPVRWPGLGREYFNSNSEKIQTFKKKKKQTH